VQFPVNALHVRVPPLHLPNTIGHTKGTAGQTEAANFLTPSLPLPSCRPPAVLPTSCMWAFRWAVINARRAPPMFSVQAIAPLFPEYLTQLAEPRAAAQSHITKLRLARCLPVQPAAGLKEHLHIYGEALQNGAAHPHLHPHCECRGSGAQREPTRSVEIPSGGSLSSWLCPPALPLLTQHGAEKRARKGRHDQAWACSCHL
jgi:hypothetical protein